MTLYMCAVGYNDVEVNSENPGEHVGQTYKCWIPANGETYAGRYDVTFTAPGSGTNPEPGPPATSTTPSPTAQDVADFLGEGTDAAVVALAGKHLPFVTATVKAYTRGAGFSPGPADDLALVIVASTARLVTNPALAKNETIGTYSVGHAGFLGWTLPEHAILSRYRKRAL